MRKRKTRMLRHEWQEAYFTLKGTRLAMHPDAESSRTQTLEYVDIDDYAIACSSLGSSKLNAAFRAVNFFARDGGKERRTNDPLGAFSFQLIPQEKANGTGMRLKKRESNNSAKSTSQHHHQNSQDSSTTGSSAVSSTTSLTSASLTSASSSSSATPHQEGINTTGKTHHFAVRNREERIDWMRELMLAKALKQKTAGFEVSVNGNMI